MKMKKISGEALIEQGADLVIERCENCHHYTDGCDKRRCWE